ncbi:Serine/threonine-protein kinase TBK1 [Orchesella cincta]|uniref:Serine/threonine-protein kinase TBK1 n=1 Tax=Orchesella cincta TaxID=48709 RepID=A0A1D2N2D6_ORCCI|nr:Serine/threonine-protein kinase TBK1 [Orchesella cincta]
MPCSNSIKRPINVFRGMHKVTGEAVAVKVFKNGVVPARELEVIQKTNHVNIVKLLAHEVDESSPYNLQKVIIMELCDGGSLLKILEHPKNAFGLEEDEFLTVVRDITLGMKYLRENGIIHRDLKPGNIMRYIADDRSSIYKITDFGAARELKDEEEYTSIYGTHEYVDPDVYEQALFANTAMPKKKFTPSTDLWSIGATLYHVATGVLPFRPVDGGRNNPKVMHLMTTQKESGVISAYQIEGKNGPVIFEKHLPKNCLLSPDLKKLICPLLAGLMEVDPKKKLSYESFFLNVDEILNRTQVNIFNINKSQLLRLFINPNETKTFEDLKGVVQSHTLIYPENQILFFKDTTLDGILGNGTLDVCTKLPKTAKTNPVILCDRANTEVYWKSDDALFKKQLFPNMVTLANDAKIAAHNCKVAYLIKRQIEDACQKVNLIYTSVQTINHVVMTQLTSASKENNLIRKVVQSINNQFEMMEGFNQICNVFAKLVPGDLESSSSIHESVKKLEGIYSSEHNDFQKLSEMLLQLKPSIDSLLGSRVQNKFLMNSWEAFTTRVKGLEEFARFGKIADTLVYNIGQAYREINVYLTSLSRRSGASQSGDKFLHLIERNKMAQEMDKLEKHHVFCSDNFSALNSVFSEWYKLAIAAYVQPEILTKDLLSLQERMFESENFLNAAVRNFKSQLEKVSESLASVPVVVVGSSIQNSQCHKDEESTRVRVARLQELARVQKEVQTNFKINKELCNQLHGLLIGSCSGKSS